MAQTGKFSLKQMMTSITVVSFACLALAKDTRPCALLWFNVVLLTVYAATLAAFFSTGIERARNAGYAIGVLGYLHLMTFAQQALATSVITVPLGEWITGGTAGMISWGESSYNFASFTLHVCISVIVGLGGGLLGSYKCSRSQMSGD